MNHILLLVGALFILLEEQLHAQVSVQSSAAASIKYSPAAAPQAYISTLSSAKVHPDTNVHVHNEDRHDAVSQKCPTCSPSSKHPYNGTKKWSYKKINGALSVEDWKLAWPTCADNLQSPVDIQAKDTVRWVNLLSPLSLDLSGTSGTGIIKGSILNNGRTIGVKVDHTVTPIILTGGPLSYQRFQLRQFHFHYGCERGTGSEHKVDGKYADGEAHFVFSNTKYSELHTAMEQPDGLAIFSVQMQIGSGFENEVFEEIAKLSSLVKKPGTSASLDSGLSLLRLVPGFSLGLGNIGIFSYHGSLSTPPCSQSVTVLLAKNPLLISEAVIAKLRLVLGDNGQSLCGNVRPVQPLNKRVVEFHSPPAVFSTDESVPMNFLVPLEQQSISVTLSPHRHSEPSPTPACVHATHTPVQTTHVPVQTTHTPVQTTHAPVQTTHAPVQTTHAPVQTTHAPVQTTHAPVQTTHAPVQTTHAPVQTTHAPVQTTHAPVQMTHAPVQTTHVPVQTTHAPVQTTHAPVQTTHAPVQTTHVPVQTTHAPVQTTHAPVQTTHAPVQTTHAPVQTTHAAVQTTHAAVQTTHAAVQTTHAPVQTTHVPVQTTHAPVQTTHAPVQTTHAPVQTTHTPVQTTHSVMAPVTTTHATTQGKSVKADATSPEKGSEVPATETSTDSSEDAEKKHRQRQLGSFMAIPGRVG